ncbi:MAG: hypothetical protein PWQ49_273 [Methanohalophilus sp.]|nr:hypothetical protein [Methanohalophilus sp.]
MLEDAGKIFVIGCGVCATKLHVGGEPEVKQMCCKLQEAGKDVIGGAVAKAACNVKSMNALLELDPRIGETDSLLIMSCGSGLSIIASVVNLPVYPATNTCSLGGISCGEVKENQCAMCGDCIANFFGGICPTARCPKGLLNGPCGGSMDGKCEVDPEKDCVWELIYVRLKDLGRLDLLDRIFEPKEYNA